MKIFIIFLIILSILFFTFNLYRTIMKCRKKKIENLPEVLDIDYVITKS